MPDRNPDWTRDELILALDLYFREPSARGSKSHPAVKALSTILNRLPIHGRTDRHEKFRNPNGVGMKLSNFLRYDPSYPGRGLARGNRLEEEVWNRYATDRSLLVAVATAIRDNALSPLPGVSSVDVEGLEEAAEGALLTRVHRVRERDPALAHSKKLRVLRETNALRCEVCEFDFERAYGELGAGFAECHHTKALSSLRSTEKTRLSDLAVVCANCHRMIHRTRPWLTLEELRRVLRRP